MPASAKEAEAAGGNLAAKHSPSEHVRCLETGFRFDSAVTGAIG